MHHTCQLGQVFFFFFQAYSIVDEFSFSVVLLAFERDILKSPR